MLKVCLNNETLRYEEICFTETPGTNPVGFLRDRLKFRIEKEGY